VSAFPLVPLRSVTLDAQTGPFGSQLHSDEYVDEGIPVINPSNIINSKISPDPGVAITEEKSERLARHRLEPGDLVFARRGELGRAAVAHNEAAGWLCGTGSLRVRTRQSALDSRFAEYVLQSASTRAYFEMSAVGSTMGNLNTSIVLGLPIPLPPSDEQRRIADFLDAETARIDTLASIQRQARTILFERRTANVFAAVTGSASIERMPSKLAWADLLPVTWKSVKLGHFARMGSGHTPSRSHPEWWEDCTIPWITTGEVSQVRDDRREVLTETRECISEIGMANSSAELHLKGTVVLCRTASAGYSAIMGEDMATSQDFVTWICGPFLDPFYLLWCLRAMRSDLLGRLAMGSTHKTIYVPDLQMLRIPLPPIAEQQRIVSSIHAANMAIDAAVDVIDRQLALLAERRQALITAAVTGGISV
jgi:type I restriction enzyme, S subunit